MRRAPRIMAIVLAGLVWLAAAPAPAAHLPQLRLLSSDLVPWQGEEIVVTLEIRTTARPLGVMTPVWPLLDNCAGDEPVLDPPRMEEGRPPQLVQTVRRAIRPLRPGPLILDTIGIRHHGKLLTAPPLTLRVRPLPTDGKPDDFGGAIGDLVLLLDAAGRGTREVRLTMTAAAPLDDFPAPRPFLGDDEHLIPLSDENTGHPPGQRSRVLRYLYLPGEGRRGALTFTLPFFHPETGHYRSARVAVDENYARYALSLLLIVLGGIPLLLWLAYLLGTPKTISGALQRILETSPTGIPRAELLTRLGGRGIPRSLLDELRRFWDECDRAAFSPQPEDLPPRRRKRSERRLAKRLFKAVDKRRPIP